MTQDRRIGTRSGCSPALFPGECCLLVGSILDEVNPTCLFGMSLKSGELGIFVYVNHISIGLAG